MKRQGALDLLRLICVILVMALHMCSSVWKALPLFTPGWALATALRQTWAVPVLVMISGGFLIPGGQGLGRYLRRNGIQFCLWSGIYQLYYLALRWPEMDWKGFAAGCITGAYHQWYLWMLLGLYAMTPLLRAIRENRRLCGYVLGLSWLTGCLRWLGPLLGAPVEAVGEMLHVNLGYTGLYLLGHCLRRWPPEGKGLYGLGLGCWVISILGNLVLTGKTGANSEYFTQYLSPTMMPVAGAVYLFFLRHPLEDRGKWLRGASRLSLGAYLAHALVNEGVVALLGRERLTANPGWMIPGTALVALGSFALAWILERMWQCGCGYRHRLGGRC